MKKNHNASFAKQTTYYLLSALIITFILISIILGNSLQHVMNGNAYIQSQTVATNVLLVFEKQIEQMQNIPNNIMHLFGHITYDNAISLPGKILKSYPATIGCSVHYNIKHPKVSRHPYICAHREENGMIDYDLLEPDWNIDTIPALRKYSSKDFWITSTVEEHRTIALCHTLYDSYGKPFGILKIDFSTKTITDFLCDYKIFKSGFLFIIDNQGSFIAYPSQKIEQKHNLHSFSEICPKDASLYRRFLYGETGCGTFSYNEARHYIYYTAIPQMNWRLGITCPHNEVMLSYNKLYISLVVCLGLGLLFTFLCIIYIIQRLSTPLRQLAYAARQMAKGRFYIELPLQNSNREIRELYESFQYMQRNIADYIERLKNSMIEKEQLNSEMRLARSIQQRFLPADIVCPKNIQLFAELRQSKEVGGDFYEYFIMNNYLYFTIGDVAGKGIPAALYMASIVKFFRYLAYGKTSTAEICNIINKNVCEDRADEMYITMFMGIMDLKTGIITFTNAGHAYPLIIHPNHEVSSLNQYPDVPLGILERHKYTEHIYTLHKNMTLLLYTDGVTDSENRNSQFYGKEKLIDFIKSTTDNNPESLIKRILEDIELHMDGAAQSDDLTLLSILYKGFSEK